MANQIQKTASNLRALDQNFKEKCKEWTLGLNSRNRGWLALGLLAFGIWQGGHTSAHAGTIIRANTPGANEMGNTNQPVTQPFASFVTLPAPGNAVFETYEGTATIVGTPNIALVFSSENAGGPDRWEYHAWTGAGSANTDGGVLQMDAVTQDSRFSITFIPSAASGVILNSFNFVGDTNNSADYQFRVDIVDLQSGLVVQTTTTDSWQTDTSLNPGNSQTWAGAPKVDLNFTGEIGNAYRLDIVRLNSSSGSRDMAIDNLDFDQFNSPDSLLLDSLAGWWQFNDPNDLGAATVGNDLSIVGQAPTHSDILADDRVVPYQLDGVITTATGTANYLLANHNIGANGLGTRPNNYALVYDILVPGTGAWRALFQTDLTNSNDAQYFVRSSNNTLGRSTISYSNSPINPNQWHRLIINVDLDQGIFDTYLDGELFHSHNSPAPDGEFSLDPGQILFFADENNENVSVSIGNLGIFGTTLSPSLIAKLGTPGISLTASPSSQAPGNITEVSRPSDIQAGDAAIFAFQAIDPQDFSVQFQLDRGDGVLSEWTSFADSGTPKNLANTWPLPGTYTPSVRVRNRFGEVSTWQQLAPITVSGVPDLTILIGPYLQNGSTDRMVVMLESDQLVSLEVEYGFTSGYGQSVAMSAVPSGGSTYFYRALLPDLAADTTYHYRISAPGGIGITADKTFKTAPEGWQDISFSALGDIQRSNVRTTSELRFAWDEDPWEPAKSMLQEMVDRDLDFMIGLGDHAQDGNTYTPTRQSHLERTADIFGRHAPFYIGWGNHDGSNPNHPLRLSADMPSRFRTDTLSATQPSSGYGSFTFTHSGVHFTCLEHFACFTGSHSWISNSANNDITNGWLDQALSSPEAQNARFRVLVIHVPPFVERWMSPSNRTPLINHLVPRLEQYNVDLCMSGHMHAYERGKINGVQYVVSGAGSYLDHGEPLRDNLSSSTDDGLWLGGHVDVPGEYAVQSSFGVLGPPEPIEGGLFHGYSQITVRDRYLRLDQHAFNINGSYIGILDTIEIGGSDPGPDSNGDGMRDAWKIANGLDPFDDTGRNAPDADIDGDGLTNLEEFIAGTNPNDRNSAFAIQSVHANSDTDFELTWSSVPGRRYHVQWSDDLNNWHTVESSPGVPHTILGTDNESQTSVELSLPDLDQPKAFFRITVSR